MASNRRGAAGTRVTGRPDPKFKPNRLSVFALAALTTVAGLTTASAQTAPPHWTLQGAVEKAELIFEGTVVDITFRDADPLPDTEAGLPHSFVTYRVEDVVLGKPASRRMTLRFLGGWSRRSGRITIAAGGPLFAVGDRDILLVAGNGKATCPLVGCGLGRFRTEEGRVFSDGGFAVRADAAGRLRAGPDRLPPEGLTMTFPAAPKARLRAVRRQLAEDNELSEADRSTLRRRLKDMSGPRVISLGRLVDEQPTNPPSAPPVDIATFKKLIAMISERYPSDPDPIPSASPRAPIKVYALSASQPKEPPGPVSQPPSRPPTVEQQLLQRNNGNPVLRAQP